MNREDKLREELEEAWFAYVMEKISQEEGAELDALNEQLKADPQYAVPEELRRRSLETIRKLSAQEKRRKAAKATGRIFVRVVCAAAVAAMMLGTVYASLPSARKMAVLNLLMEAKEVSTRLVMEDVNRIENNPGTSTGKPTVLLGYQIPEMPEGFSIVSEKHMESQSWIKYATQSGEAVTFRFYNGSSESIEVDSEKTDDMPIQINGVEGRMWVKEKYIKIAWNDPNTKTLISVTSEGMDSPTVEELAKRICLVK